MQGRRHVQGRPQPAARRAVLGPETLWVANNAEDADRRQPDADRPARPASRAQPIPVDDPYNMYFTPDGKSAIVVAEAHQAARLPRPADDGAAVLDRRRRTARGINHADFSIDGRYAIFTCEFDGSRGEDRPASTARCSGYLQRCSQIADKGMPQDIRISPDGTALLRRRHDGRRRPRDRRRRASRRSASSPPASARTASTRAATARSSTSPTAARTRSTARARQGQRRR